MKPRFWIVVVGLVMAPIVIAEPNIHADHGQERACEVSGNPNPCRNVIPDTNVSSGQNKHYTGAYTATGTVIVHEGASVTFEDADVSFQAASQGVLVKNGGSLWIIRSAFSASSPSSTAFAIDAMSGSELVINDSFVRGGQGARIATENANVSGNTFRDIPRAMLLDDVSVTIHHNRFVNNEVGVNETGGFPRLENNSFEGGEYCVRDWRSDPAIIGNSFLGCHWGIWHEESESQITDNTMSDDGFPPGVGLAVINTQSPIVERNVIRHFGTGILVVNARAFIRNNTIEENAGDGIRVETNSLPMDIQGNLIQRNGGAGIRLMSTADVPVTNNVVVDNGADGVVVVSTPDAFLAGNVVQGNAGHGIVLASDSPRAQLADNTASLNNGTGLVVAANGVSVTHGAFSGNAVHGIRIDHALGVSVVDSTALGNGVDGVFMAASRATITRVNASGNGANGFKYDPQGPLELLGATPLNSVRAFYNGGAGLLNVRGNATSASDSWWQGNARAGIANEDLTGVIDARNNYWGSPNGPSTTALATGGDRVEGGVLYVPFRTAPPP